MYEPKRIPRITETSAPLSEMRYGITKSEDFIDLADPTIDPLHIHGYLEIFFSIDAEVSFFVNDEVYHVKRGDLVISRPGDVHVCIFPKDAVYSYYCLWIDADFSSPFFAFLAKKDFSPLISLDMEEVTAVASALNALYTLPQEKKRSVKETSMLLTVLLALSEPRSANKPNAAVPVMLSEIIRFIKQNFVEIHSISDITKKFFISPSTLNRHFRTHLHTSPRDYVEAQKLAYALELLKNGAGVTEACIEAGFSDCSHFIVLFKKKFGTTPLKYKKQIQEKEFISYML